MSFQAALLLENSSFLPEDAAAQPPGKGVCPHCKTAKDRKKRA